ncbi:MAG: hypothetical protein V2A78_12240 [bacterium]
MKKLIILALMASLLTVYCPRDAQASKVTLFVHNREFTDPTIFVKDVLYAPLESLLKAMRCGWTQTGTQIEITAAAASPLLPITGEMLTFSFKGKAFAPTLLTKSGTLYVSVPEMAEGLQARFDLNKESGIADVIRPRILTAEEIRQEMKPAGPAKGEAGPPDPQGPQGPGKEEQSPIVIKVDSYPERDTTGSSLTYFRPRAIIKNISKETVKKVSVTLHYQDLSGKDLNAETKTIGDMAAGQELTYDYYWVNSSGIEIAVFMTEEHEVPKKEETKK